MNHPLQFYAPGGFYINDSLSITSLSYSMKTCWLLIALCASPVLFAQHKTDSIITKTSLQETLAVLASDSLEGRLTGTIGAEKAAYFIADKMMRAGLTPLPGTTAWFDSFPVPGQGKKTVGLNVIGFLPASWQIDSSIIFSAHYDHLGKGKNLSYMEPPDKEDEIYNGANDNATGVAAILELAKYYAANTHNRYNLVFIAFSGEEMGLVGSTAYAKKLKSKTVKAAINLEMLGRPTNERCYIVALGNHHLRKQLNTTMGKFNGNPAEKFFGADTYSEEQLEYRSDHYPLSRKIKTAFTIMGTSPADDYYHSVDDEFGTIDFDFLLKATRNIALACEYFTR